MKQYVLQYEERERYHKVSDEVEPIPEIHNNSKNWRQTSVSTEEKPEEVESGG